MTQAYFAGRPMVNETLPDEHQHRRELARAVNANTMGYNNTTLSLTLDGATTTIIDRRISLQTAVLLMPTSAAAAAAKPALWVTCSKGQAVIHAGVVGATFTAVLIG